MLIKYTKQKYSDAMLNQWSIHLSTFWHFQAHKIPEIGDPDEGQSGYIFFNNTDEPWAITPDLLDAVEVDLIVFYCNAKTRQRSILQSTVVMIEIAGKILAEEYISAQYLHMRPRFWFKLVGGLLITVGLWAAW